MTPLTATAESALVPLVTLAVLAIGVAEITFVTVANWQRWKKGESVAATTEKLTPRMPRAAPIASWSSPTRFTPSRDTPRSERGGERVYEESGE